MIIKIIITIKIIINNYDKNNINILQCHTLKVVFLLQDRQGEEAGGIIYFAENKLLGLKFIFLKIQSFNTFTEGLHVSICIIKIFCLIVPFV